MAAAAAASPRVSASAAITAEGGELRTGIVTVPMSGSRLSEKEEIGSKTDQHPAAMVVVPRTSFGRVFVDNNLLEQEQMQGTHTCHAAHANHRRPVLIHHHQHRRHLTQQNPTIISPIFSLPR
jgi:hypothetical protein